MKDLQIPFGALLALLFSGCSTHSDSALSAPPGTPEEAVPVYHLLEACMKGDQVLVERVIDDSFSHFVVDARGATQFMTDFAPTQSMDHCDLRVSHSDPLRKGHMLPDQFAVVTIVFDGQTNTPVSLTVQQQGLQWWVVSPLKPYGTNADEVLRRHQQPH